MGTRTVTPVGAATGSIALTSDHFAGSNVTAENGTIVLNGNNPSGAFRHYSVYDEKVTVTVDFALADDWTGANGLGLMYIQLRGGLHTGDPDITGCDFWYPYTQKGVYVEISASDGLNLIVDSSGSGNRPRVANYMGASDLKTLMARGTDNTLSWQVRDIPGEDGNATGVGVTLWINGLVKQVNNKVEYVIEADDTNKEALFSPAWMAWHVMFGTSDEYPSTIKEIKFGKDTGSIALTANNFQGNNSTLVLNENGIPLTQANDTKAFTGYKIYDEKISFTLDCVFGSDLAGSNNSGLGTLDIQLRGGQNSSKEALDGSESYGWIYNAISGTESARVLAFEIGATGLNLLCNITGRNVVHTFMNQEEMQALNGKTVRLPVR